MANSSKIGKWDRGSLRDRFQAQYQIISDSGCWVWTGADRGNGYGCIMHNGTLKSAHRVSYEIHNGEIPRGMFVCHRCDVPECVNPDHLFLGTPKENTADMHAKGRHSAPSGMAHHASIFSEKEVREIFTSSLPTSLLAKKYNVCPSTISKIKHRTRWASVTEDLV